MSASMTKQRDALILIIEDETRLSALLKWRLEVSGYTVRTHTKGKAGLEDMSDRRPDLLILDLNLPDMHGFEVCQRIRKTHNAWVLPILMVTAMNQPVDQVRGFAFGADAYITKPFSMPELLRTVDLLLKGAEPLPKE